MGRARGEWVLAAVLGAWSVGEGAARAGPPPTSGQQARAALKTSLPAGVGVYHIRVGSGLGGGKGRNVHAGEHYTGSAVNIRNRVLDSHHLTAATLLDYDDVHVLFWRLDPAGQPAYRVCDCVTWWEQRVYEHIDGPLTASGKPVKPKGSHNQARAMPAARMEALAPVCEKMKLIGPALAYPAQGKLTTKEQTPPPAYVPSGASSSPPVRPHITDPMLSALRDGLPQTHGIYWLNTPCEYPIHAYVGSADDVRSRLLYQDHPKARMVLEAPRPSVATWTLDMSRAQLPPGRDPGEVCACLTFAEQVIMDEILGKNPAWAPPNMQSLVPGQVVLNSGRAMAKERMNDPGMMAMCYPVLGTLELRWPPPNSCPFQPPAQPGPQGGSPPAQGGGPPAETLLCKTPAQPCESDDDCCPDGKTSAPWPEAKSSIWRAKCVEKVEGKPRVCVKPVCRTGGQSCTNIYNETSLTWALPSCCLDGATEKPPPGDTFGYRCVPTNDAKTAGKCQQ